MRQVKRYAGMMVLCVWLSSGLAWAQSAPTPGRAARATPETRERIRGEVQDQRQQRHAPSRQLNAEERQQLREQIGEAQRQQQGRSPGQQGAGKHREERRR